MACTCGFGKDADPPLNYYAIRDHIFTYGSGEHIGYVAGTLGEDPQSVHTDDEPAAAPPVDSEDLAGTLSRWWASRAEEEAATVVPKAVEYGGAHTASDLIDLGRTMAHLMDLSEDELTDGELQELGIFFYIVGKVGRWKAALLEGRAVSDDTIYDIGIYIKMVQRIRDAGGWPV